jgi:hypothetical protein
MAAIAGGLGSVVSVAEDSARVYNAVKNGDNDAAVGLVVAAGVNMVGDEYATAQAALLGFRVAAPTRNVYVVGIATTISGGLGHYGYDSIIASRVRAIFAGERYAQ